MKPCAFPDCPHPARTRGLCNAHSVQWYRNHTHKPLRTPTKAPCKAPDCDRPAQARGYCHAHHKRRLRGSQLTLPIRPYHYQETRP